MEPLITHPISDEKKTSLFLYSGYSSTDDLLRQYVQLFLSDNQISGYALPPLITRKLIATGIFSLILFLDIVEYCLYHAHFVWNAIILLVSGLVYSVYIGRQSVEGYLMREIKRRPHDDMDDILVSQVSGAKNARPGNLLCVAILVGTLILSGILFSKPHIIYEKNTMFGYSIRYYTVALHNEDRIELPDSYQGLPVNEIRGNVFRNMTMSYIRLPKEITEIRAYTFENCTNLRSIQIPEKVYRIASHAFYGCTSLRDVELPSGLKTIGSSAFRRCYSLYNITVPAGCDVNSRAFKESPTHVTMAGGGSDAVSDN